MTDKPFWQRKTLAQMTPAEWESLCDGCGKCCLHKFIEDDSVDEAVSSRHINEGEQLHYSKIACRYLNDKSCDCNQYVKRTTLVPDCITLSKDNLKDTHLMPPSCAYRRLYEGRSLPDWHPLLHKGKKSAMHKAGMSVRGKVISEEFADVGHFEKYIVSWPLEDRG